MNLANNCRLCTTEKTDFVEFIPLDGQIIRIVYELTKLQLKEFIEENSQQICIKCYQMVREFHKFKQIIIESNKYFEALGQTTSANQNKAKFTCNICGKRSMTKRRHVGHLREAHQGLLPANCEICNTAFESFKKLDYHNAAIHGTEMSCDYPGCMKTFTVKSALNHHKQFHDKSNTSICEECGVVLSSRTALKNHMIVHTKNRCYRCEVCSKNFGTKSYLNNHMKRHLGIKNYECHFCGLKKTTLNELNDHLNYHTREKLFNCPYCSKEYPKKGSMNRHIEVVHLGVRKYSCDICSKSFGKADTLRHHRMTHTGEKPHECKTCLKRFIQLVALKTHLKIHEKNHEISKQ